MLSLSFAKDNPLPDNKILALSELKAFVNNKLNFSQNIKIDLRREELIVGKEEIAGNQHFLLFSTMFSNCFFQVFLCLEALQCNTISDWLNRMV